MMLFLLIALSFGNIGVFAAETTEEVTTEEVTTGAVAEDGLDIYIDDEGAVYIDGVKLTKEQLLQITYEALEENFGSEIATVLIVVVASILALLGFGTWGITRVTQNIRATRDLKATNDKVVNVGDDVDKNTASILKLESREAKSQAMQALILKGLSIIMANSTNQNILGSASSFKEEVDRVLSIDDNIKDALQIVKSASKEIKETVIGETVQTIKAKKNEILNSMIDEE